MRMDLPPRLSRYQWLQRMGYEGKPDIDLLMQLAEAEEKLFAAAMPQGIYRVMPVEAITPHGEAIKKHLEGCDEVAIMGVTLGAMVDNLIRTSQVRNMAEAFILDCGASVLVERIASDLESCVMREQEKYTTVRYSPGYGDYPVTLQAELIWLMDAHRKIGLTVNKNFMLTPQKSVTAVMGMSDHPVSGYLATCEECTIREKCELRKKGKNCVGLQK